MKYLLFLVVWALPWALFGQSKTPDYGTPQERAEKLTERMKGELSLRADQVDKVFSLNLKYAQIMQVEILDRDLSSWSRYNKGLQINKRKEKELQPLLSTEQYAAYEKLRNQAMQKILFGGSSASGFR